MFRSLLTLVALVPVVSVGGVASEPPPLANDLRVSIELVGPAGKSAHVVRTTPGAHSSAGGGPYQMTAAVRGVVPCSIVVESVDLHPEGEPKPVIVAVNLPMRIGQRIERTVRTSSGDVIAALEVTGAGKCAPGASGHSERIEDKQAGLIGRVCLGALVTPLEALRRSRITRDQAATIPSEFGLVASIDDGTPAALAGVKSGDVLIAFDGIDLRAPSDLTDRVSARKPGDAFEAEVYRDGVISRRSGRLGAIDRSGQDLLCRPVEHSPTTNGEQGS